MNYFLSSGVSTINYHKILQLYLNSLNYKYSLQSAFKFFGKSRLGYLGLICPEPV